jgi:formate dehydrogenase maturation protein FdhE
MSKVKLPADFATHISDTLGTAKSEIDQLENQRQAVLQRFHNDLAVFKENRLRPLRELEENFNAYVNIASTIIQRQASEIKSLHLEKAALQEENKRLKAEAEKPKKT